MVARSGATLISQPMVSRTASTDRALVQRVEAHLAGLVEVVDAEVGDDDRRAAALPAALAPDAFGLLGAAQVAGARPEVDGLDEAAPALAHDHEHLPGVDRDLARTAADPGRRVWGASYGPMTVVLMLPKRSIWAAPRNPTSISPPCR